MLGVAGIISVVKAQTSIEGGDSFDSAVEIETGSYQGGSLEHEEMEYFYIASIKLGQEVSIKGTFAPASTTYGALATLSLHSKNNEELIEKSEAIYESESSLTISWLSNAEEDTYKYYTNTTTKKGTNWGLILGVVAAIVIIIIAIIVIVVFTFLKAKGSKKEKSIKTEDNVEKESKIEKNEDIQSEG